MAVADVPGSELALGAGFLPFGVPVTDLLTATLLLDHKLLIIREDQGQVGLGGFLHVANIRDPAGFGKRRGRFAECHSGLPDGAESDSIAKRRILCALRLQDPGTFP